MNTKSKIIKILDLFAGTQSVRKALTKLLNITCGKYENGIGIGFRYGDKVVEYIGLDIYSPEGQNTHFDLTQDNMVKKLLETLPQGGKPDFIWSSPVCNKFSTACAATNGNLFFEKVNDRTIKIREDFNVSMNPIYKKPENGPRYQEEARVALKMHNNGKEIINYFNVPFVIENPRLAMSKYLYKEYTHNYASYCMYGFDYRKNTTFYSNKEIELKKCTHKGTHKIALSSNSKEYKKNNQKNMTNYAKRSSVPPLLIKEIIKKVLHNL